MFILLGDDIHESLPYRLFPKGFLAYLTHGDDGQFLPDVNILAAFRRLWWLIRTFFLRLEV
jgi:hypothetical protein